MYPYLRLIKVVIQSQFKPKMGFYSEKYDEINLTVLPNDIDPFMELNNGRYVTLLDLGRYAYGGRIKMGTFLKKNNWSLTIVGTYNEYRYRLKLFRKFQLKSKIIGYDEKNSIQKTLRKPEDQLKEFKGAGKVALRKYLDEIKTTDTKLNGRINLDTILLKVSG